MPDELWAERIENDVIALRVNLNPRTLLDAEFFA